MKELFLNSIEDIGWLLSTHLKSSKMVFNSFIIYGNEDCPEKVELFKRVMPTANSKPFATFVINEGLKLELSH